jgi:hypothetical protein
MNQNTVVDLLECLWKYGSALALLVVGYLIYFYSLLPRAVTDLLFLQ